ncbi:hypothetical protein D3C72_1033850 [compost metagenome]
MPVPSLTALVVKKGSKILSSSSGGTPGPVSDTSIRAISPAASRQPMSRAWASVRRRVLMVTTPAPGSTTPRMASRALTARFMTAVSSWLLSARTRGMSRP